ncbi:MAG: hypothetical protein ACRELX_16195, partial [Longimicrobiales bacterium]
VIWVGTDDGNVQVTRDGGATWTNVRANVPGLPAETWVGDVHASPSERGAAFIAVDNHRLDDFTPHVWETRDYGATWRDLSAGLPQDDYAKIVRQHPTQPDLLFVGMERGIQASFDHGETWIDIRNNLPRVSVRGLTIEPRYNDLVIGTHGRGAWILDDIGPLVHLAAAMGEETHLFPVRTATRWESWDRDSNLGSSYYEGENPPEGAIVNYWLAGEAALTDGSGSGSGSGSGNADDDGNGNVGAGVADSVVVRITDSQGRLVREIVDDEVGAGVNRIVWDLEWAGPTPLSSEDDEDGGRDGGGGPPAAPGMYTATLVANGGELSREFELRADPAVEATQADFDAQLTAALQVRELQSQVNGMIDAVVDVSGQLGALRDAIEGKDVPNADRILSLSERAMMRLDSLENSLHRPPPRMGYRQYPRLAEELSFVNRGITGALARPTEGQLQAVTEIGTETEQKAAELQQLLDTTISELNQLLEDQPKILPGWQRRPRISLVR